MHRIIKYLHVPNLNYYDLSVCSKDARYKLSRCSHFTHHRFVSTKSKTPMGRVTAGPL